MQPASAVMVALKAIDLADAIEPGERQDDASMRHPSADKTGIATLRHDRDIRLGAFLNDEGYFFGVTGAHHG